MKFSELEFGPHPGFKNTGMDAQQAEVTFPNGYGASVVSGAMFYTSEGRPYELAVTKGDEGELCYDTPITDDVMGHLTAEEVEEALSEIEALPPTEPGKVPS